jgi:hypothetical protein
MQMRERIVLVAAIAVAVLFGVDRWWFRPWLARRDAILKKHEDLVRERNEMQKVVARRSQSEAKWKAMDAALRKQNAPELADVSTELIGHMISMTSGLNINLSVSGGGSADISAGTAVKGSTSKPQVYREWTQETKFDCNPAQLFDLLKAISESSELIRTRRITIHSDPEKEKLDVELRVSSIERKR